MLASTGTPVKNALVELWHADREGDYVYSAGVGRNAACDVNFAGFGQFLTGSTGAFKFRTVKAGLYNGRTHHTHFGVTLPGRTTRTTTQTAGMKPRSATPGEFAAYQPVGLPDVLRQDRSQSGKKFRCERIHGGKVEVGSQRASLRE